jgi:MFS family permease
MRTASLLAASTLAGFGAWIDFLVILAMAAYAYHADGFVMALVSALFLVPSMLLGPWLGRRIDRGDPGRVLVAGLALRAAATALLALQPSLPLFCFGVALRSAFSVAVDPAFNVAVGRVVARDAVPRYFGTLGLMRNGSKIGAPVLGTSLASAFGDAAALALAVALTLLALPLAWACTRGAGAGAAAPRTHVPQRGAAARSALLMRLLATVTVFAFVVFFINNQLPVLLRDAGFDKALLGVLVSCSGAGGIVAAMYLARAGNAAVRARDPMTATTLAVIAVALCFVALGFAFRLPPAAAPFVAGPLFFCTGVFASVEAIRSNTVIVQHFEGRAGEVSARVQAWSSAAMLAAPWAAALLIPRLTLPALMILDGAVGAALVVGVTLVLRAPRRAAAVPN